MADKVVLMDRAYREKHYPNGYFAAVAKNARGGGVALIICGLVLALMGLGILALEAAIFTAGDAADSISEIIVIGIVGLVFLVPGIFVIRFGIRRMKSNETDWIKKFVDASDYPESIIRDFGNQVLEDQSLRLRLDSLEGTLTRDYISIANFMAPCIIKIEDVTGAYLVETSYQVNINGKTKTAYTTSIAVFSNHNTYMYATAKEKTVKQIQEILLQRNPAIDTAGGRMLSEKEFQEMEAKVNKASK